jgi:hypothetical protein
MFFRAKIMALEKKDDHIADLLYNILKYFAQIKVESYFILYFQCISTLAFVKNEPEVLDSPIWVMVINIGKLRVQPHVRAETHKIKSN